jgi:hypothetical protein
MASTPVVRAPRPFSHARGVPNPQGKAHQSDTTTTTTRAGVRGGRSAKRARGDVFIPELVIQTLFPHMDTMYETDVEHATKNELLIHAVQQPIALRVHHSHSVN